MGRKGEFIKPSKAQFNTLEVIIRKVIAGEIRRQDKLKLVEIARSLKDRGAEGIILGCTELPLIFPKRFEIPVFDSLEILARALLKAHFKEERNTL
ncbi:MAG: aspartate/glutamate racemase family protein [Candidatus Daviesbacteria bacterium]|nr:aspartate/glutamate racemase family protein [Candidatus Daviesbacteria bacterium]